MTLKSRHAPVWALVLMDAALLGLSLCVFALFHHVLPRASGVTGTQILSARDTATFALAEATFSPTFSPTASPALSPTASAQPARASSRGAHASRGGGSLGSVASAETALSADSSRETLDTLETENARATVERVTLGEGEEQITYYVADARVTSVEALRTAFAGGVYGANYRDTVAAMAADSGALLAISGDYYGNGSDGVVIRNGVLYRAEPAGADVCVLYADGVMETVAAADFDADAAIARGAWQAWTFGPALLDGAGNVLSSFRTTGYINSENPRCAVGYVAPGHYVLVVVDGRDEGYSRGATLTELARIMAAEGCLTAYNLDGGQSAVMVARGEVVNSPDRGGRAISDIIYLAGTEDAQ